DLVSYAAGLPPMRLGPFCVATGLGMAPAIFLTAAAGDLGWRSPWALVAGVAGIAALAGLVVLVRPVVKRGLGGWHGSAGAPEGGSLLGQQDSRPPGCARARRAPPRRARPGGAGAGPAVRPKSPESRWRRKRRERCTRDFTAGRLMPSSSPISGFAIPSMSWRTKAVR